MAKRLLIAALLLPFVGLIIFSRNPYWFMGLAVAALVMAQNELYVMMKKREMESFRFTGIAFSITAYALIIFEYPLSFYFFALALFVMGLFFQLIVGKDVRSFPKIFNTLGPVAYITTLGSFGLLLRHLEYGWVWIFILMLMTLVYDGGAYFAGSAMGKTKLIPELSPGKTVEGCVGGVLLNLLVSVIIYFTVIKRLLPMDFLSKHSMLTHMLVLPFLLSFFGQIGDISASVIKRFTGVKNSSNLLPEHGGALDKIDSAMFNAPVLYVYVKYIILAN